MGPDRITHEAAGKTPSRLLRRCAALVGVAGAIIALILVPDRVHATLRFVAVSLVDVAPLVLPGILISAWVSASGAGDRVASAFRGRVLPGVIAASAVGAVTPVCGVTVLPLMAGLLASRVPLAPVMAFWLSSPITDPAMLATTAATLGFGFAIGKTLAAFALGLLGGLATAALAARAWTREPLRRNRFVANLGGPTCAPAGDGSAAFEARIWSSPERRARFGRELRGMTRLILICLVPAFAAEYVLNAVLRPQALTAYVGAEAWWAVPFAVFVGAPAYLDGYAALPLTRALIDHGMSQGAAMAFLVSGGVVSVWGAMAIFPVLRIKPFLLYLALAVTGSMGAGWGYGLLAG